MEFNGKQIPIAISLAYYKEICSQELTTHFTLINKDLLLNNEGTAIKDLWKRFFSYFTVDNLSFEESKIIIFMHN